MPKLSPLSLIDPKAKLADDVEIGPFCTVGPDVVLGPGNVLVSHVVITGQTTIGQGNVFYPNAVIGTPPQDKKFRGEATRLTIGNFNEFREAVTIHVGTGLGGGLTSVGDHNLLMVNCHIGHDCHVGNRCVIANNVLLAGHVVVEDFAVISGAAAVHHFVTIGAYSFVAGMVRVHHDVPPFVKVSDGDQIRTINSLGLRRSGMVESDICALEAAAKRLFLRRKKPISLVMAEFDLMNGVNPQVKRMIEFLRRRDTGRQGRYLESLRAR